MVLSNLDYMNSLFIGLPEVDLKKCKSTEHLCQVDIEFLNDLPDDLRKPMETDISNQNSKLIEI